MIYKVAGIVSSPRKGMNTDTLVTKVLEGAIAAGAEVEKVFLNELEIMPCQACKKFPAPKFCFYKDGMDQVYNILENADALVIGTPAYFGTMSAQLKLMIDRSNCLANMTTIPGGKLVFKSRLKKKKGIFIWVANISKNIEHAMVTMRIWCKYFANIDLENTMVVTDSDLDEGARNRPKIIDKAFKMGKSLIENK